MDLITALRDSHTAVIAQKNEDLVSYCHHFVLVEIKNLLSIQVIPSSFGQFISMIKPYCVWLSIFWCPHSKKDLRLIGEYHFRVFSNEGNYPTYSRKRASVTLWPLRSQHHQTRLSSHCMKGKTIILFIILLGDVCFQVNTQKTIILTGALWKL